MQYSSVDNGYILRIATAEELIATIEQFSKEQEIYGASFHGLGACKNAKLGMYHMDEREYDFQEYNSQMEIANVSGNVARKDGSVIVHAHATLGDANQRAYAGHLQKAIIQPTCEIHLLTTDEIQRSYEEPAGLDLLSL